jgi:hypothetical protein
MGPRGWTDLRRVVRRATFTVGVHVGRELRAAFGPEARAPLAPLLRAPPPAPGTPGDERAAVYDADGRLVGYATVTPVDHRRGR